jgi:magnesium transporter
MAVVAQPTAQEAVSVRVFRHGQRPTVCRPEDLAVLRTEAGALFWVDMLAPSEVDFNVVMRAFEIDPNAAATVRTVKRRPLVRAYDDHYLITLLSFQVDEAQHSPRIRVVEVDLLVGANFCISVHKRVLPFAAELEERTMVNPLRVWSNSSSLVYLFMETLVATYVRQLDHVERRVERLQLELLREPGRKALDDAILLTRHVQTLRRLVSPHTETISTLLAVESPWLTLSTSETNFRDLLSQLRSLVDHLDHTRDMVTGGYTLYISNVSFRTNEQLKVLTVLSAILLPTTLITGLFGTNFKLAEYDAWQPFYVMLVGMGVIAWAMLLFFRWRRWL